MTMIKNVFFCIAKAKVDTPVGTGMDYYVMIQITHHRSQMDMDGWRRMADVIQICEQ
jgi:hypothetical protein